MVARENESVTGQKNCICQFFFVMVTNEVTLKGLGRRAAEVLKKVPFS